MPWKRGFFVSKLTAKHLPLLTATGLLLGLLAACNAPDEDDAQQHTQHTQQQQPKPEQPTQTAPQTQSALPIVVESSQIVAVPEAIGETSALLTLRNTSQQDVRISKVSSPLAGHAMVMVTVKNGGMMGMRQAPFLLVPASGTLTMRTDGDHLMLMQLKQPLKEGDKWQIRISDTTGRSLSTSAIVKKP